MDTWLHSFLNASLVATSPLTRGATERRLRGPSATEMNCLSGESSARVGVGLNLCPLGKKKSKLSPSPLLTRRRSPIHPCVRRPPTAVQTAIVALHLHPTVASSGITLLRSAREIKGVGSLDTVGKATGADILVRAEKTLLEEVEDSVKVQKYMQVDLELNDTVSEWWTGTEAVDTDADVDDRLMDLFAFLQFSGGSAAIVVGHSLLFREILRRYMSLECREVGDVQLTRRRCALLLRLGFHAVAGA